MIKIDLNEETGKFFITELAQDELATIITSVVYCAKEFKTAKTEDEKETLGRVNDTAQSLLKALIDRETREKK